LKPEMLNKYNFINIISSSLAGITGGFYLYTLFPDYFRHPVLSAILYAIFFFMICLFAGRIKRSVWNMLDKKWLYILESFLVLGLLAYSYANSFFNYWNSAGIILLGYLIIYTSRTIRENIIKFIFFLLSPVFYFGMFFQNSYFTETIFAVSFLLLMDRIFTRGSIDHYFIMSAIILAFLVFINPFLAILFFVFASYCFRQELKKGGLFFLIAVVAFYFIESFLKNQVVVLSLPHLSISIWMIILLILIFISAVYTGWISRNVYEVFFSAMLIILTTIIICAISIQSSFMPLLNIVTPLLSTIFPLLIFAVRDYDTEEHIGKILDD
jgi:hypothetical protein